jgi:hypothetical protein
MKKIPIDEFEFVKNLNTLQPPVFETLKPSFGVTLIEGSKTKASTEK